VAVLASGEGTNLHALLDDPVTGPWIVLVVSDRSGAAALRRAEQVGVRAVFVDPAACPTRTEYDRKLLQLLEAAAIEYVALAGFMRVLGPEMVRAFEGRMLNIHPSLLPEFPGATAVADALAAGVDRTGVTVHFVDEGIDTGPVVAQEEVPVLPGDDADSLAGRIHAVEHRMYPAVLRALVEGRVRMDGGRVTVKEG
jgi:phosphoribosylglycinamide formyltransferase-1